MVAVRVAVMVVPVYHRTNLRGMIFFTETLTVMFWQESGAIGTTVVPVLFYRLS